MSTYKLRIKRYSLCESQILIFEIHGEPVKPLILMKRNKNTRKSTFDFEIR